MKRRFNAFALAATAITLTTINTADAGGCGGHGGHGGHGGYSMGFGGGQVVSGAPYGGQNHSYPTQSHSSMFQSQPGYSQPSFPQPSFPQQEFSQPVYSQDGFPIQGGFSGQNFPQQGGYSQNSFPQQGGFSQQGGSPQQGGFSQPQPSIRNAQPRMQASNGSMNQAGMSQPQQSQQQTFGSGNQMNGQNVPQQNVPQQNVRQSNGNFAQQGSMPGNSHQQASSQPGANNGLAQNSSGNVGMGAAPLQNTGAATGGQTQLSALQMLASISGDASLSQAQAQEQIVAPIANQPAQAPMAPTAMAPTATAAEVPEFTAAASPMAGAHVGTWAVSLPGNQTIVLALNNDNSFSWNASKDGKQSSFQGQYRLEGSRLTLVRSNDLQQMAGSWNGSDANFTFKLDGATTSGLAFARN